MNGKTEAIEQIWEFIGHTGDVVTRAHLFDNEVKTEDHLSVQKIITVLVKYGYKMEETLGEMRKLLPKPTAAGTSQPQPQTTIAPSPKGKAQQMMDSFKERLQQRKVQEAVAAAAKITVPTPEVFPATVLVASPSTKGKKMEAEPVSRAASSHPASQRSGKKKEKIPTPEVRELESEEESVAEEATGSEEEEVPSTPEPDLKPKGRETRSSSKKKPGPIYRSSFAPKRQSKTPAKGRRFNQETARQVDRKVI